MALLQMDCFHLQLMSSLFLKWYNIIKILVLLFKSQLPIYICLNLNLQLPMQSLSIITDVVSSNLIRVRCTTLCDKVCQWLATALCFFPGPPVSSTNKTDRHDITEILLKVMKVALNTIKQTNNILDIIDSHVMWYKQWTTTTIYLYAFTNIFFYKILLVIVKKKTFLSIWVHPIVQLGSCSSI